MIFMSQTGITDATREAELDAWYVDHLRIMLTVKGVDSTQRFKTTSAGYPPSLAMYWWRALTFSRTRITSACAAWASGIR